MGANDLTKLELSVGRWGNSLAVRLPADLAREMGVQEGGRVQAYVQGGVLYMQPLQAVQAAESRVRMIEELRKLHETLPITRPVSREELSRY